MICDTDPTCNDLTVSIGGRASSENNINSCVIVIVLSFRVNELQDHDALCTSLFNENGSYLSSLHHYDWSVISELTHPTSNVVSKMLIRPMSKNSFRTHAEVMHFDCPNALRRLDYQERVVPIPKLPASRHGETMRQEIDGDLGTFRSSL